jgi:hypothetical protein
VSVGRAPLALESASHGRLPARRTAAVVNYRHKSNAGVTGLVSTDPVFANLETCGADPKLPARRPEPAIRSSPKSDRSVVPPRPAKAIAREGRGYRATQGTHLLGRDARATREAGQVRGLLGRAHLAARPPVELSLLVLPRKGSAPRYLRGAHGAAAADHRPFSVDSRRARGRRWGGGHSAPEAQRRRSRDLKPSWR